MIWLAATLLGLLSLLCWVIVVIAAFSDELWKGIASLLCGLYWLFYALFEFEHEYKWAIVLLGLAGGSASAAMLRSLG